MMNFLKFNSKRYSRNTVKFRDISVSMHKKFSSHVRVMNNDGFDIAIKGTINSNSTRVTDTKSSIVNINGVNIVVDKTKEYLGFIYLWDCNEILAGTILNDVYTPAKNLDFASTEDFEISVKRLCKLDILPQRFIKFLDEPDGLVKYRPEFSRYDEEVVENPFDVTASAMADFARSLDNIHIDGAEDEDEYYNDEDE